LGNIEVRAGSAGAHYTYFLEGVKPSELWGRAMIVHADEDDLGRGSHEDSKTTGHSGARIGCAVFGRL
jgi:Cu/Zn superoxide dismutase